MFVSRYHSEFLQYYELRTTVLSDSAHKHELCYLKRFDKFIADYSGSDESELSENFINKWVYSLKGTSGSRTNEIIVIRQFLGYLNLNGHNAFIPIIPKVHDDYSPYIFSDKELELIFLSADNTTVKDKKACRYLPIEFPVIVKLLFGCGLRIGETVRIRMNNVDLENGILKLINTKGNKHRLVPMTEKMTDILSKYCLAMGLFANREAWLFPSNFPEHHISEKSVQHRFEQILKENSIELRNRKKHERGPCLHCMRHIFAFKSFEKTQKLGMTLNDSVPFLSIYLGHDSLNETEKYLKFSSEMYPDTVELFGSFIEGLLPEVDYET